MHPLQRLEYKFKKKIILSVFKKLRNFLYLPNNNKKSH